MTATYSTAPTLLVAIDISKHRHEVLIGAPGKKRHRRMTITNTLDDFGRLVAALSGYGLPVRIGFEATGNYHRALAHHLGQAGFELKLVSSVGLARTREAPAPSFDQSRRTMTAHDQVYMPLGYNLFCVVDGPFWGTSSFLEQ